MSLKKLLELQGKITEINEPAASKHKPIGSFIMGESTQEAEPEKMKAGGIVKPDATVSDVRWLIVTFVTSATLETPLRESQVIAGKNLVKRNEDKDRELALFQEALDFEQRHRKLKT